MQKSKLPNKVDELLEDALLIHRIANARERRVYYIDVGSMLPEEAAKHLEEIRAKFNKK